MDEDANADNTSNYLSTFAAMENLLEKLKILNYEQVLFNEAKMKPIHKYYFAVTKNPGEQFYLFSLLASFLINRLNDGTKLLATPQEYDDPNDTIDRIVKIVQDHKIPVNFPSNKLKQGVGEHVVYVLNCLADRVLESTDFSWKKLSVPEEQADEVEVIDDESEINLDRVEEEMMAAYSDDSDNEDLLFFSKETKIPNNKSQSLNVTKTDVDDESWQLELERVLPQLKLTIKNENRDWRTHLEMMKNYKGNIDGSLGTVRSQLERIQKDIGHTTDKIASREKYLNRELEPLLDEYRDLQEQLSKSKEDYKRIGKVSAEKNRELAKLTDRLESVKQQMEERGSSMTDGTPLVNIKKCVTKIKSELEDMDVRIGVLECLLLQSKIRSEKILENEFGQTNPMMMMLA